MSDLVNYDQLKGRVKKETVSMLTRDGVRLDADVYRPEAECEFPVLLMRQPYGRAIASTVVYAHPSWYAAHGYIVVIQDVRGRGSSEGKFSLFEREVEDGFDSVNWVAGLAGSNGLVGMYGFSYQGMTQLYAAATQPAPLKALCPAMVGYDLYTDWAYEGGAFCLQANLGWAVQLAAETARLQDDLMAYQVLYSASGNLPFYNSSSLFNKSLRKYAPNNFYQQWLEYSQPGEYWEKLSPKRLMEDVDLPMLHIGGWFDTFLRGTIHCYKEIASRASTPQHLVVGPWGHLPWGRKLGIVDYGVEAASPVDQLQVQWFDQFLKGKETGVLDNPPVCLFEMGSNRWRYFKDWPSNNQQSYLLTSTGLASLRDDSGRLVDLQRQEIKNSFDIFVHDPWRPVPALGGHAAIPTGQCDRSVLDCRTDILTYTSSPLTEDLSLAGEVIVEVFCQADAPSFDLSAVLSEVHGNSSVYNLTQGYWRVNPGKNTNPLAIKLQPTCIRIAEGNALRLSLSAACFPAYPVNPGTGEAAGETNLMDARIITLTVSCGTDFPSQVLLPVVREL